jgi:hypothetical protein
VDIACFWHSDACNVFSALTAVRYMQDLVECA